MTISTSDTIDRPQATRSRARRGFTTRSAGDSLGAYLAEVSRYPLLTSDEELALARRIQAGDDDAANELVSRNLRFVVSVARKYHGGNLSLMDLISEGNVGLLAAARRFDPERGVKFISYAVWWVRQAIMLAVARQAHIVRVPVERVSELSSVAKAAESFRQQHGREPSTGELADVVGLPVEAVEEYRSLAAGELSLDAPLGDDGDRTVAEQLSVNPMPSAEEEARDATLAEQVRKALLGLPEREAMILRLYFGLGGEQEQSLEKIGSTLGVTRQRVRDIKDRALRRLRLGAHCAVLSDLAS